jgi:outer membrane immunogenic protein
VRTDSVRRRRAGQGACLQSSGGSGYFAELDRLLRRYCRRLRLGQGCATVFGVETDLSYADIKGSTIGTDPASGNCAVPANPNCESTIRALGTARGRLGLAWQNLLPYVTGGLAYANLHGAEGVTGTGGSGSKWVPGWTIGAGLEGILAPNWSVKAEYLYVDLGRHEVFTDVFGGVPTPESLRETAHIVRVGVNYRFGYR